MKKFVGWDMDTAAETQRVQTRYARDMRALARVRRDVKAEKQKETIMCRCTTATIFEFGTSR